MYGDTALGEETRDWGGFGAEGSLRGSSTELCWAWAGAVGGGGIRERVVGETTLGVEFQCGRMHN